MSEDVRMSPLGKDVVNPAWSPDGTQIAFHLSIDGDPLFVGDADGQNRVLISKLEKGIHQHYPVWSSDGEWIYVSRGRPGTHMDLWRISADGQVEEQLTWDKRDVAYPAPIDEKTLLFVARREDGAGPWLWVLDVENGACSRAYTGVERYLSVAASLDGRRLVATVANPTRHLLSVPLLRDREAGGDDVQQVKGLENEFASAPRFGQDGRLFFISAGGVWGERDGEQQQVLPPKKMPAGCPRPFHRMASPSPWFLGNAGDRCCMSRAQMGWSAPLFQRPWRCKGHRRGRRVATGLPLVAKTRRARACSCSSSPERRPRRRESSTDMR